MKKYKYITEMCLSILLLVIAQDVLFAPPKNAEEQIIDSVAYIKVNEESNKLLLFEKRAKENKNWNAVVTTLQKLIEEDFDNSVVNLKDNLFCSINKVVIEELKTLPPECVKVYRDTYEETARYYLNEALKENSQAKLLKIYKRFPLTDSGYAAVSNASSLMIESAEFAKSAILIKKALYLYPNTMDVSELYYNLAISLFYLKNKAELAQYALIAPSTEVQYQDNKIQLNKLFQTLADKIQLKENKDFECSSWKMINKDASGNPISKNIISKITNYWKYNIDNTNLKQMAYYPNRSFGETFIRMGDDRYTPFFPTTDGMSIFVSDGIELKAFDSYVGNENEANPKWIFSSRFNDTSKIFFDERIIHSPTIYKDTVFANLVLSVNNKNKASIVMGLEYIYSFPFRALFAVEKSTGKLKWFQGGNALSEDFIRKISFPSPPAVENDKVYVGGYYFKEDTNPREFYVCCFDANKGNLLWKTFVCSGFLELNLFNSPAREAIPAPISISDNIIYSMSNLGVISALDKDSGEIKWIYKYKQYKPINSVKTLPNRLPTGWFNNSVVCTPNFIVCAPVDSPFLYILDPKTGENYIPPIKRMRNDWMRYVVGVVNNVLIISGDTKIKAYRIAKQQQPVLLWEGFADRGYFSGKPAITKNFVIAGTFNGLKFFDINTGAVLKSIQFSGLEPIKGNIIPTDRLLIMSTKDSIYSLCDSQIVLNYWREISEKEPKNEQYKLAFANSLMNDNQIEKALKILFEIKNLKIEHKPGILSEVNLNIYNASLKLFIQKKWNKSNLINLDEEISLLMNLAPSLKNSLEVVNLGVDIFAVNNMPEKGIELYQNFLKKYANKTIDDQEVWQIVKNNISELLNKYGKDLYNKYDEIVRKKINSVKDVTDVNQIVDIIQKYPNTSMANDIYFKIALAFFKNANYENSKFYCSLVFNNENDLNKLVNVSALLVKNLISTGHKAFAQQLISDILLKYDDNTKISLENVFEGSVSDFVNALYNEYGLGEDKISKAKPSTQPKSYKQKWINTLKRLKQLEIEYFKINAEPFKYYYISTYSSGYGYTLSALTIASGQEIWNKRFDKRIFNLAIYGNKYVIGATNSNIFSLNAETGEFLWTYNSIELDEMMMKIFIREYCTYAIGFKLNGQSFQIRIIDNSTGGISSTIRIQSAELNYNNAILNERYIVLQSKAQDKKNIILVNKFTGEIITMPIEDGAYVASYSSSIVGIINKKELSIYEYPNKKKLWSIKSNKTFAKVMITDKYCIYYERLITGKHQNIVVLDLETQEKILNIDKKDLTNMISFGVLANKLYILNLMQNNKYGVTLYDINEKKEIFQFENGMLFDIIKNDNYLYILAGKYVPQKRGVELECLVINQDNGKVENKFMEKGLCKKAFLQMMPKGFCVVADSYVSYYSDRGD